MKEDIFRCSAAINDIINVAHFSEGTKLLVTRVELKRKGESRDFFETTRKCIVEKEYERYFKVKVIGGTSPYCVAINKIDIFLGNLKIEQVLSF